MGEEGTLVGFWGASSECLKNYWGVDDSPLPVIAWAWGGIVSPILLMGGREPFSLYSAPRFGRPAGGARMGG